MILTILMASICLTGCLTKRVTVFVRSTRLPEEAKGFARIAQQTADITVKGKMIKAADVGGRVVILDADLAAFVRIKVRLQKILRDAELKAAIHKKGL